MKTRFIASTTSLAILKKGSVAEWSKALVLGTSPKGRGFESHRCQTFFLHRNGTRVSNLDRQKFIVPTMTGLEPVSAEIMQDLCS